MKVRYEHTLPCVDPRDRFSAAVLTLRLARRAGASARVASELATAAAELASNLVRHGGGGSLTLRWIDTPRSLMEIVARDEGPGITDVAAAMRDGWSRGRPRTVDDPCDGLGSGLGAVRRATDELTVSEREPRGTLVLARRYL